VKHVMIGVCVVLIAIAANAPAQSKTRLAPDTPKSSIADMDPAKVDPSDLPLDRVGQLHPTGTPQEVSDLSSWRLSLGGKGLGSPLALAYAELAALPLVKKRVLLVCPGYFADYAEWEGVPLSVLLEKAKARPDFINVSFTSYDGYTARFTREEAASHLLFLAVRVNGETLPTTHGYPVRLVAEDLYGARWVKWIKEIHVE
jgi:DMSO/TMAO reductase YedYZ molybdopterin-dependent catalytic subunit